MTVKLIGAVLIVIGCGGFGFHVAASQKREEHLLQQLIKILDFFTCELQYRQSPLPVLCREVTSECSGVLQKLFLSLANELELQISPDVGMCMRTALSSVSDMPTSVSSILLCLGHSLGRFDLDGQIKDLEAIRHQSQDKLAALRQNRDVRLRTYKTLGLCVGAALAILFI